MVCIAALGDKPLNSGGMGLCIFYLSINVCFLSMQIDELDEGDVIQRTVVIYHISDQFSSPFKQLTKKLEVSCAVVSYFQIRSFGLPLICSFSLRQGQGDGTSFVVSGVWSSGQLTFFLSPL